MATELIDELIEALRVLPGVGPKSAQRIALHLLQRNRRGGLRLGETLIRAMRDVTQCEQCRIFTEISPCRWCRDATRDAAQLCVVENPADVLAIDRSTSYNGRFFLLLGRLSPLDGIGPKELGLEQLEARLAEGGVRELTLATNPTVEGQATAGFIADLAARHDVTVLQFARGLPVGSELEFADSGTLAVAFDRRVPLGS